MKIKAQGYLDKLLRGYRVYVIRHGVKDGNGNNIVLHESWHQDLSKANDVYKTVTGKLLMVSEYSNCPSVPEVTSMDQGPEYWNEVFGLSVKE
jgi:hypothetical protein